MSHRGCKIWNRNQRIHPSLELKGHKYWLKNRIVHYVDDNINDMFKRLIRYTDEKAIDLLNRNDRENFREYVNKNTFFNPHHMFITKPKIMNEWFKSVFEWLFKCEEVFDFKKLSGYETRLYGYLAERYLSYWFNKKTKTVEWPWTFVDMNEGKRTDV